MLGSVRITFRSTIRFMVTARCPKRIRRVRGRVSIGVVSVGLGRLYSNLSIMFSDRRNVRGGRCLLPSASGTPVQVGTSSQE